MEKQNQGGQAMSGPLVGILLAGLHKATGPAYEKLLEQTPWQKFLKHPPSTDPKVMASTGEEFSLVSQHIYKVVGRDLFITFGRYAGIEGGKIFAASLKPVVESALSGLSGVPRLQRAAELHMQIFAQQTGAFSMSNTADGVTVISNNCQVCSRIVSAEPVCTFISDGLRSSYSILSGYQVIVKEIECRAQGKGTKCVFTATVG